MGKDLRTIANLIVKNKPLDLPSNKIFEAHSETSSGSQPVPSSSDPSGYSSCIVVKSVDKFLQFEKNIARPILGAEKATSPEYWELVGLLFSEPIKLGNQLVLEEKNNEMMMMMQNAEDGSTRDE